MPNTGHRWTDAEDRAALIAWPEYDAFCLIIGRDDITYHAFRHRVRYLRSIGREFKPGLWARFTHWLRSFGL